MHDCFPSCLSVHPFACLSVYLFGSLKLQSACCTPSVCLLASLSFKSLPRPRCLPSLPPPPLPLPLSFSPSPLSPFFAPSSLLLPLSLSFSLSHSFSL